MLKVSPEDAIIGEKCIVYTDVLISLLTDHHGSICREVVAVHFILPKHVGTCLVVSWRCSAGHFGGRWAAQPTCSNVRAGNLILASSLLLSGHSFTKNRDDVQIL